MAAHARWLLDREGPRGRTLVFAANGHVSAGPMVGSVMRVFPRQPKLMEPGCTTRSAATTARS